MSNPSLKDFLTKKSHRLGIFSGPMASTTVSLHGLRIQDALNIVERKINRARRAGGEEIKIVFEKESAPKFRRQLMEFLESCPEVASAQFDEENPGAIMVTMASAPRS